MLMVLNLTNSVISPFYMTTLYVMKYLRQANFIRTKDLFSSQDWGLTAQDCIVSLVQLLVTMSGR
jgi:hypothetical protein